MVYTGTARGGYSAIGLQVYLMLNWAQSARHKILCKDLAVSSSQFFCMYVTSIPTTCMPYVAAAGGRRRVVAPGGGAPLFDMKKTSRPASIYRAGPSINDVISRDVFFDPFTSHHKVFQFYGFTLTDADSAHF